MLQEFLSWNFKEYMQESELATDEPSSTTCFQNPSDQLIPGSHTRLNYCSPQGKDKTHGFSNQSEQMKLLLSLPA